MERHVIRAEAQFTLRENYMNGGPGVCVSGLVWILAAIMTWQSGFTHGIIVFFFGGMFIHPVSVLIERILRKAPPSSAPDKGLVRLSILTLPILFGGLYLAYVLSARDQSLFYPVMAVVIGLRYLIFKRIYGLLMFIGLGITLIFIGIGTYFLKFELLWVPFIVGVTELIFGLALMFFLGSTSSKRS